MNSFNKSSGMLRPAPPFKFTTRSLTSSCCSLSVSNPSTSGKIVEPFYLHPYNCRICSALHNIEKAVCRCFLLENVDGRGIVAIYCQRIIYNLIFNYFTLTGQELVRCYDVFWVFLCPELDQPQLPKLDHCITIALTHRILARAKQ